jgi:methylglutamate dehydrogenase subunit D
MTMSQTDLVPVSGFAGLPAPPTGGVVIRELDGMGLATVLVKKGQDATLASRIAELHDISLLATGPGTWLVVNKDGGNAFVSSLRDAVGDLASVVDQSDGLAAVSVAGPTVRDVLCKLFAIDLDASVFQVGDVAVTPAGHVGATLWRDEDTGSGSAVFVIAVHRSFAASFWEHLVAAASGLGQALDGGSRR